MAKRSFSGRPKKKKSPAGGDIFAQMQQMQQEMMKAQEELANVTTTVTAGGGAIEVEISGHQRIIAIKIDPDLLADIDVEMLQDMLVAGMNAAIEKSQSLSAERMEGLTGDIGINDLLGGLGGG
jgi:DNA-binding YbaB/EbfC family protein